MVIPINGLNGLIRDWRGSWPEAWRRWNLVDEELKMFLHNLPETPSKVRIAKTIVDEEIYSLSELKESYGRLRRCPNVGRITLQRLEAALGIEVFYRDKAESRFSWKMLADLYG